MGEFSKNSNFINLELDIVDSEKNYCSLSDSKLDFRLKDIKENILIKAMEIIELKNGYSIKFPFDSNLEKRILRMIELENKCCSFLNFKITKTHPDSIFLNITGPSESKNLIYNFFNPKS